MKTGKLSFQLNETTNEREIDTSELFRVFPPKEKEEVASNVAGNTASNAVQEMKLALELEFERRRIKDLERENEDLRHQRDSWQKQAETLLLTAPKPTHAEIVTPAQVEQPAPPPVKNGILKRLFG